MNPEWITAILAVCSLGATMFMGYIAQNLKIQLMDLRGVLMGEIEKLRKEISADYLKQRIDRLEHGQRANRKQIHMHAGVLQGVASCLPVEYSSKYENVMMRAQAAVDRRWADGGPE